MPPIICARSLAAAAGILATICSSSNAQVYDSCQGAWDRYVIADHEYNKASDEIYKILQQLNEAKPWLNELQLLTAGAEANALNDEAKARMKDLEERRNILNAELKAEQTKFKETETSSRDAKENARADYDGCVRQAINRDQQPRPNGQLQQAATQQSGPLGAQTTAPTAAICPPGAAYRDVGDGDCDPIAANAGTPPAIASSQPTAPAGTVAGISPTQAQPPGNVVREQPKAKPKKKTVAKKRIRAPTDEDAPTPVAQQRGVDPGTAALVGGILGSGISIGIGRR